MAPRPRTLPRLGILTRSTIPRVSDSESFAHTDRPASPPPHQPTARLAQMKRASTTDLLAQTCSAVAAMDLAQMKRESTTFLLVQTLDTARI